MFSSFCAVIMDTRGENIKSLGFLQVSSFRQSLSVFEEERSWCSALPLPRSDINRISLLPSFDGAQLPLHWALLLAGNGKLVVLTLHLLNVVALADASLDG